MSNVDVKFDKTKDIEKSLKKMASSYVVVGIPQKSASRKPEPGESSTPTNAEIGYINEKGSPARNIPARPFLVPGVKDTEKDISRITKSSADAVLDGRKSVDHALELIGQKAVSNVKKRIVNSVDMKPLAKKTRERRKNYKPGDIAKPLIDTGQLLNSITYVVID